VVSGGCGDHDAMSLVEEPGVDDGDLPPPHLPGIVAAFAAAAAVAEAGGATDKTHEDRSRLTLT
jgi:hypothetical protein